MTTVARTIGQRLYAAGVRHVLGHPGGEVVDLIDGLRAEGLEFVLTKHEATAAFMADAMGTYQGNIPGVCLGTLGPGATNLVTGVAHAYLDRAPVIALSAQLDMDRYEIVTHQRLDLSALFAPITKSHARVTSTNAATVVDRAVRVSTRTRPGPVYLEVPSNVPSLEARPAAADLSDMSFAASFGDEAASAAARLLRASARPIILAGIDSLDVASAEALKSLAEEWSIPVMVSPKAKGVFREDHPLFLGTIEMLGTLKLYEYIDTCDLVVMAGFDPVEFDLDWSADARVIHVGPLPNDDLYFRADAELVGPVAGGLHALLDSAAPASHKHDQNEVKLARDAFLAYLEPRGSGLAAQDVLRELRAILPEDAIMTCDVGRNKSVVGQCWPAYRPKTFFMSNGLSSMGYGFASAMGLQLLEPERRVACVIGDGGFAMYLGEVETAVRRGLPILAVILVDQALTQIKQLQERKGVPPTGTTFGAIDYVALARAFGADGAEIHRLDECRDVFRWALERQGPTVIAVYVDPD